MKKLLFILLFTIAALLLGAYYLLGGLMSSSEPMKTVPRVDLNRFMGDWYVIANIPTIVEKQAVNAVESYRLREDGTVDITFTFRNKAVDGELKKLTARGFIFDKKSNAEWRVQFFWPIKFPYKVIDLDADYSYTVIGVPNRKYVWIMARTSVMDDSTYTKIVDRLVSEYGYDRSKISKVPQIWKMKEEQPATDR